MSRLSGRMERLYKGLSARARVAELYGALCKGEEPDFIVRGSMPRSQVGEFNRLAKVANGLFDVICPAALVLRLEAEAAGLRFGSLALLSAWGSERAALADAALEEMGENGPSEKADRVVAVLDAGPGRLTEALVVPDREGQAPSYDAGARATAEMLRDKVPELWGRLLALETVLELALEEIGAEGVVPPDLRSSLESARRDLEHIAEHGPEVLGECFLVPESVPERDYEELRARVLDPDGDRPLDFRL